MNEDQLFIYLKELEARIKALEALTSHLRPD